MSQVISYNVESEDVIFIQGIEDETRTIFAFPVAANQAVLLDAKIIAIINDGSDGAGGVGAAAYVRDGAAALSNPFAEKSSFESNAANPSLKIGFDTFGNNAVINFKAPFAEVWDVKLVVKYITINGTS